MQNELVELALRERWVEADRAASVLVVERGIVLVARAPDGGRRVIVAIAGRDAAVLAAAPDAETVALTAARLRVCNASDASDALCAALRDRDKSLAILALPRHVDRVRAKLLQLARMHGNVTPDGVAIALPLTHEVIADMTASGRETATWRCAS